MLDVELYGMSPRGHHLSNVALHAVSSLLLLLLLVRMTGRLWQSSCVAALFALHPLHVESVAWVAERKDVLSGFFWISTLLLYAVYVTNRKKSWYLLTLFSFLLGLMSKPMLVTLPLILLLVDFWPLDRYRDAAQQGEAQLRGRVLQLLKEKLPFFACALLSGIVTIYAQQRGGAVSSLDAVPFGFRVQNALVAYLKYLGKTLWPRDLAVLYPMPLTLPLWQVIVSLLVLLAVSAAVIRFGRRFPYLPVGWFWFLITLLPVIGLLKVGSQSMADRYMYLPAIGLFIMAAWGVSDLTLRSPYRKGILALLFAAAVTASAALSWQQLGHWRDDVTLYQHTLSVTSRNYLIHYLLGDALAKQGDLEGAIREHRTALEISPAFTEARNSLGIALTSAGAWDEAVQEFQTVLGLNPRHKNAHYNLGFVLARKGELDAAIRSFQEALRIDLDYAEAHTHLGIAFARKGELAAAIREFSEVLRINPEDDQARNNLALALEQQRRQGQVGQ